MKVVVDVRLAEPLHNALQTAYERLTAFSAVSALCSRQRVILRHARSILFSRQRTERLVGALWSSSKGVQIGQPTVQHC